jgi:putative transposase
MFKRIPKEIKDEIVSKVKQGVKVRDLAEQYGISSKTVYSWLRVDSGENVVSLIKYNKLKKENQELKRLIGELSLNLSLGKKNRAN